MTINRILRGLPVGLTTVWLTASTLLAQTPEAQTGFVPVQSLPPGQELPAAPLLIGSYASFLVLMVFYLWTIWRRIDKVEAEMGDLERRQGGKGR